MLPQPTVPANDSKGIHYRPVWVPGSPAFSDLAYFLTAFPEASILQSCSPVFPEDSFWFKPELALPAMPTIVRPGMGPVASPAGALTSSGPSATLAPVATISATIHANERPSDLSDVIQSAVVSTTESSNLIQGESPPAATSASEDQGTRLPSATPPPVGGPSLASGGASDLESISSQPSDAQMPMPTANDASSASSAISVVPQIAPALSSGGQVSQMLAGSHPVSENTVAEPSTNPLNYIPGDSAVFTTPPLRFSASSGIASTLVRWQSVTSNQWELAVGTSTTTLPAMSTAIPQASSYMLSGQTVVVSAGSVYLETGPNHLDKSSSDSAHNQVLTASEDSEGETLVFMGSSTLTIPAATALPVTTFVFASQTFVRTGTRLVVGSQTMIPGTPITTHADPIAQGSLVDAGTMLKVTTTTSATRTDLGNIAGYIMSGLMPDTPNSSNGSSATTIIGSTSTVAATPLTAQSSGHQRREIWTLSGLVTLVLMCRYAAG